MRVLLVEDLLTHTHILTGYDSDSTICVLGGEKKVRGS